MQYIKGGFSFQLKSKFDVWEKSYANHRVLDAEDYLRHVEYIEENPVRAHIVEQPKAFLFSSARFKLDPMPDHFNETIRG